jgi:hypothetical protein
VSGAAPAALPSGGLAGETIVEFVNARFAALRQPGRMLDMLPAVAVAI